MRDGKLTFHHEFKNLWRFEFPLGHPVTKVWQRLGGSEQELYGWEHQFANGPEREVSEAGTR